MKTKLVSVEEDLSLRGGLEEIDLWPNLKSIYHETGATTFLFAQPICHLFAYEVV